ncbi:MAG: lipopolysaccharide biosynthesis protein [Bacteroidales bacterium]|nr:lipopolysaccharide biosynthesis protein [Bacteroidales bacterium]
MSSLKKLFSDSVIYGLSSIVGKFLNYLLVPLYTYKIAVASGGYGVITNIYAYTALLQVILTFGMETTFFYFASKVRREAASPEEGKRAAQRVFSTSLIAVGTVSALFVAVVLLFLGPLATSLGYGAHPEFVRVMACVVAIDAFQAILFALLRFQGRAWKFAFLKLAFIFCNIGLNLFVFLLAPVLAADPAYDWLMGWYDPSRQVGYVFQVNLICTATVTLGFLPELRLLRHGLDFPMLKSMLRYTWPLLLLGIVGILNQVADKICYRFIVPGPEGEVQLGIYGACVKIAMIMAMITQAFRYAYEPFVFSNGKDAKSKESQALVMKYFLIFTLLAFLAVTSYLDLLKYVIDDGYWEGLRAVPIVMFAEILMGVYFNLSFWYKLIEQTWWGAIFSFVGCVVLLAVNIIFVPRIGYMACAWGGVAGYGTCVLLSYLVGRKRNPVPYPLKAIGGYTLLAIALYGLSLLLQPCSTALRLVVNTLGLLLYIAVVLWNERALVTPVLRKLHLVR